MGSSAEDNPWYLLATLYGVPKAGDDELRAKNRVAWNRYFSSNLDENTRTKLIKEKRHPPEELRFSQEELLEVKTAFANRTKKFALPTNEVTIDFSNVEFGQFAFFERYLFTETDFRRATFTQRATFSHATFTKRANFRYATFSAQAIFIRAAFSERADFHDAKFLDQASFYDATFSKLAEFRFATFSRRANFSRAKLSKMASFRDASFSRQAKFDEATFGEKCSFVNAKTEGVISFEGAIFETRPPEFFGAKLHEGTIWPGRKNWPIPKKRDEAKNFIRAYERLTLEMNKLQKHEDELEFFALELQSRRVQLGTLAGLPIAIYGVLSDYGRSYARPLYALFAVAAFGTLMLLLSGKLAPWQSPGLSIANTLNIFGFRKDFFDAATIECLPASLKILAAVQTVLGTILLFLFGLGIRNKFRMK